MTPELDAMNARVQEWLGWWKPLDCIGVISSGRGDSLCADCGQPYNQHFFCPAWTAETAMRALKQVTDHESVQDGEIAPCYHEPELWINHGRWKCRMDSWLDEVADPDPIIAVLRACDKLREMEAKDGH